MHQDIGEAWALVGLESQHLRKQIFEVGGELFPDDYFMKLPEIVILLVANRFVIRVVNRRQRKRRVARIQDENDDAKAEHVRDNRLIFCAQMDLRGHVAWRAYLGTSLAETLAIRSADIAGKAKVNRLDVEV